MKVMVMVKATKSSEACVMPTEKLLTDMGKYNEELIQAGIMQSAEGLHPSSKGVRVRFSDAERMVTDGPFAETNELVAGFWIWNVKSMQEAVDWVKRCPNPMLEDSDIEIRPVFGADDFGSEFTPELREQEAGQTARLLGLEAPRFENHRAMRIAGLKESYTLETRQQIPSQWQRFMAQLGKIPGHAKETYGVCWNCTAPCNFDYLTGVEAGDFDLLPEGFATVQIPAGRYVVVEHNLPVSKITETYDTIWTKWLPQSGLKTAATPMFERMKPDYTPQTGGVEIWIPLKS